MPQIPLRELEEILPQVRRPARYLGNEHNAVRKDFDSCQVKVALCFPDTYEIGMSNLGFKILYHLLNEQPGVVCERVFAPWVDMEEAMKRRNILLFSLESGRTLDEFDIIGFSLQYEMNYTNVLNMLSMAGIPLLSGHRGEDSPLIIAGGNCTFNPEPMADFFDAVFVGEAEEAALEIISLFTREDGRGTRDELLKELAKIEGVYVPAFYEVSYNDDGTIKSFTPKNETAPAKIKKRIVKDFNSAYYPTRQIVPYIQIVHDRISMEIMRGCPNNCFFCQAGQIYRPCRLRKPQTIIKLAEDTYAATGYEEISLVSLSTGDHPQVKEIIKELVRRFKKEGVSISLPSLRAQDILKSLPYLISSIKKTGLTFAPEAGTERLRSAVNKSFREEDLTACVTEAARSGWRRVKLYFMLGLPGESHEDILAIAAMAQKIARPDRIKNKPRICVNASVAPCVPKPHTAFEREAMDKTDMLNEKILLLKKNIKDRGVTFRFHEALLSFLEGVFSRGDRRLSRLLLEAFKRGARFDSWKECFNFGIWKEAFSACGIDPAFYVYRKRPPDEILPWDFIKKNN